MPQNTSHRMHQNIISLTMAQNTSERMHQNIQSLGMAKNTSDRMQQNTIHITGIPQNTQIQRMYAPEYMASYETEYDNSQAT